MGQHTPTPWHYQEKSDAYTHIVRGAYGQFIVQLAQDTSGDAEADARLIVTAVNTHDDLLAALTDLADVTAGLFPPGSPSDQRVTRARAVIAKARAV